MWKEHHNSRMSFSLFKCVSKSNVYIKKKHIIWQKSCHYRLICRSFCRSIDWFIVFVSKMKENSEKIFWCEIIKSWPSASTFRQRSADSVQEFNLFFHYLMLERKDSSACRWRHFFTSCQSIVATFLGATSIYIHPYTSSLHLGPRTEITYAHSLSLRPSPSLCPPLFVTSPASFRLYIPCRWQWLCPIPLGQRVPQGLNPVASFLSPPAPLWHLHRVLELPHRAELCSWI